MDVQLQPSAASKPLHIVDIAEFYSDFGGGVRSYIRQKLVHGAAAGHRISIIAPGRKTWVEERDGGTIYWVKAPIIPVDTRYHLFARKGEVHALLQQLKPDVIEGSSPWRGGWLAAQNPTKAATVLFMHADPVASYPHLLLDGWMSTSRIDSMFGWFWRYLARLGGHFNSIVVASGWLGARFAAHGVGNPVVVPLGIEKSRFDPEMRSEAVHEAMRKTCGLGPNGKVLICVGRMHPEKRVSCLIEAVAKAGLTQPIGLIIVGDGPCRRILDRQVAKHKHIVCVGVMDGATTLPHHLASADAFIHGSASETYGLAVSEALCCGTPIIVPDRGGAFAAAGSEYSEVYSAGDSDACAAAILRLLARSHDELSASAIEAAAKIPTMAEHFQQLFAHYQTLAARKSAIQSV
jgi:alpha-1,6-mannosyltransferase